MLKKVKETLSILTSGSGLPICHVWNTSYSAKCKYVINVMVGGVSDLNPLNIFNDLQDTYCVVYCVLNLFLPIKQHIIGIVIMFRFSEKVLTLAQVTSCPPFLN